MNETIHSFDKVKVTLDLNGNKAFIFFLHFYIFRFKETRFHLADDINQNEMKGTHQDIKSILLV